MIYYIKPEDKMNDIVVNNPEIGSIDFRGVSPTEDDILTLSGLKQLNTIVCYESDDFDIHEVLLKLKEKKGESIRWAIRIRK